MEAYVHSVSDATRRASSAADYDLKIQRSHLHLLAGRDLGGAIQAPEVSEESANPKGP
jgi:hypothetical protein